MECFFLSAVFCAMVKGPRVKTWAVLNGIGHQSIGIYIAIVRSSIVGWMAPMFKKIDYNMYIPEYAVTFHTYNLYLIGFF